MTGKDLISMVCGVLLVYGCATLNCAAEKGIEPKGCCSSNAVAEQTKSSHLVTPWLADSKRIRSLPSTLEWTDQDGKRGVLGDFKNQPIALSFIYTRCTNPNKCARVSNAMGKLQEWLRGTELEGRVQLLLLTYDPEFDTPAVLREYAKAQGLEPSKGLSLLRLNNKENRKLLDELEAAVNFNAGGVNMHGIQLFLFDRKARLARTYKTLLWDHASVLYDLRVLAAERE